MVLKSLSILSLGLVVLAMPLPAAAGPDSSSAWAVIAPMGVSGPIPEVVKLFAFMAFGLPSADREGPRSRALASPDGGLSTPWEGFVLQPTGNFDKEGCSLDPLGRPIPPCPGGGG